MGRKTRKKYRTSVQQTFCGNDRSKGVFKGVPSFYSVNSSAKSFRRSFILKELPPSGHPLWI
jgi:hypothetical protein